MLQRFWVSSLAMLNLLACGGEVLETSGPEDANLDGSVGADGASPAIPPPDASADRVASDVAFVLPGGNRIAYHGGPVLNAAPHVFFLWYGDWSSSPVPSILADWASGVGGTPYFAINQGYPDSSGRFVANATTFSGQVFLQAPADSSLDDRAVGNLVLNSVEEGLLARDPAAVYFLLGSKEIHETSGFCEKYCGWHSSLTTSKGLHLRYAFVGDPAQCPKACEVQDVSPNESPSADAMASVLSHELAEIVTDPDATGWSDDQGNEIGDLCAWNFGPGAVLPSGAKYNVSFGGRNWLLQKTWVNARGGFCGLHP